MYNRSALRSSQRIANSLRQTSVAASSRRFASTSPAGKKRSWKSSALRFGLAVGAVYWYSTSAIFAEEPQLTTIAPPPQFSDEDLPTVEAVVAQKRREAEARLQKAAAESTPEPAAASLAATAAPSAPAKDVETSAHTPPVQGSPEALEEEADQQGAFNPETGEINWDCPCLGGMAHGPCGEEFRAAFSCFVYSKEEPKGMDCIDKFQHMQDCFRLHPEVYGEELADDEDAAGEGVTETGNNAATTAEASPTLPTDSSSESAKGTRSPAPVEATERESGEAPPDRKRDATAPLTPKP
ncbi:hypothetical protein F5X99DRAFT_354061 [Biscogniauxia marginata]|nr:hypothetical protein F5X99DRAFT_354061 [Biscogniauxia marginata]